MLGRYQFSPELLTTIGMHGDGGAWTGALARRLGIRSERNFLNSPTAQDAAFDAFVLWAQRQARSALPIERQGRQLRQQVESIHWIRVRPSDFIGRSIEGIRGRIVVTLPGLVAAMHRRGPTDVARYLRRISENGWSSNELNLNDREREIETRLRVFSAEPLSTD